MKRISWLGALVVAVTSALLALAPTAAQATSATLSSPSGQPQHITEYCSMIASATTQDAAVAPPLVGQGCFPTLAQSRTYAANVGLAYNRAHVSAANGAVTPADSLHLGVSYSGGNYSGQRIDWWGTSGPCAGTKVYEFTNFTGWVNNGLSSDAQDVVSGAHCGKAHFFWNGNLTGNNWYCLGYVMGSTAYQTCEPWMGNGNSGHASSVRMGYEPNS